MGKGVSYLVTLGAGVVIGILLSSQCNTEAVHTRVIHDTIPGDSIPYPVEVKVPVPYKVTFTDSIPVFDTLRLIDTFFSTLSYSDTLLNDTGALIVLSESISRNRIVDRGLMFQNRRITAINNIYPEKLNRIHLGGMVGLNMAGVELDYTRKENTLRLGYSTQGVYFGYSLVIASW